MSQDSYAGTGVDRSTNDGATFQRVGDEAAGNNPLDTHTVFRIAFGPDGTAFAATDNGLFRLAAGSNQWTEVLDPAGATDFPPYDQQVTDVAVVGHVFETTDGGQSWTDISRNLRYRLRCPGSEPRQAGARHRPGRLHSG